MKEDKRGLDERLQSLGIYVTPISKFWDTRLFVDNKGNEIGHFTAFDAWKIFIHKTKTRS